MQEDAEDPADCGKRIGPPAQPHLRIAIGAVGVPPALLQRALHAHRIDRLGMPPPRFDRLLPRPIELHQLRHVPLSHPFGQQREDDQHGGARQHGHPQPGMQQEQHGDEEQHPGQVNQCGGPLPRKEASDLIDIADRLAGILGGIQAGQRDRQVMRLGLELHVDIARQMDEQLATHHVEQALECIGRNHQQQKTRQRRDASPRNDEIIDQHHVERAGEQQHVQQGTHHCDARHGTSQHGHDAAEGAMICSLDDRFHRSRSRASLLPCLQRRTLIRLQATAPISRPFRTLLAAIVRPNCLLFPIRSGHHSNK